MKLRNFHFIELHVLTVVQNAVERKEKLNRSARRVSRRFRPGHPRPAAGSWR